MKLTISEFFGLLSKSMSWSFNRTSQVLFNPFNIRSFLVLAWLYFLASLGTSGGISLPNPSGFGRGSRSGFPSEVTDFLKYNLAAAIIIGVIIVILIVAILLLLRYIGCRYRMVWLRTLLAAPEFEGYQRQSIDLGGSIFWFEVTLQLIVLGIVVIALIPLIFFIGSISALSHISSSSLMTALPILLYSIFLLFFIFLPIAIFMGLALCLTEDMVIPVMDSKNVRCYEAWKLLYPFFKENKWSFILYCIVVGFCMGMINGIAVLMSLFIIVPVALIIVAFGAVFYYLADGWNVFLLIPYVPLGIILLFSIWLITAIFRMPVAAIRRYLSYDLIKRLRPEFFPEAEVATE